MLKHIHGGSTACYRWLLVLAVYVLHSRISANNRPPYFDSQVETAGAWTARLLQNGTAAGSVVAAVVDLGVGYL